MATQTQASSLACVCDLPSSAETLAVALIASAPVAALSYALQQLGDQGSGAAELISSGPTSVLRKCPTHVWEVLTAWSPSLRGDHMKAIMCNLPAFVGRARLTS